MQLPKREFMLDVVSSCEIIPKLISDGGHIICDSDILVIFSPNVVSTSKFKKIIDQVQGVDTILFDAVEAANTDSNASLLRHISERFK